MWGTFLRRQDCPRLIHTACWCKVVNVKRHYTIRRGTSHICHDCKSDTTCTLNEILQCSWCRKLHTGGSELIWAVSRKVKRSQNVVTSPLWLVLSDWSENKRHHEILPGFRQTRLSHLRRQVSIIWIQRFWGKFAQVYSMRDCPRISSPLSEEWHVNTSKCICIMA